MIINCRLSRFRPDFQLGRDRLKGGRAEDPSFTRGWSDRPLFFFLSPDGSSLRGSFISPTLGGWNAAKCKNLCPLSSCAYDRIPFVTSLEHSLFCLVFFSFLHFSFLFFFLFFIFLLCARSERRNNWFHPFFFRRDMLWILYKELEAR